jgi:hypothetical protein
LENPVAFRLFLALFDESSILESQDANSIPAINLNNEQIPGWTFLDILADFDSKDSEMCLLQIVLDQETELQSDDEPRIVHVVISNIRIDFRVTERVKEETLLNLADRAKLLTADRSKELRRWGREYGRFLKRYRIEKMTSPKHISDTCVVVFGTELRVEGGRLGETRVALKFMNNEGSFRREIDNRRETEPKYVVPIRACYAAHRLKDLDSSHVQDFQFGVDFAKENLNRTKKSYV